MPSPVNTMGQSYSPGASVKSEPDSKPPSRPSSRGSTGAPPRPQVIQVLGTVKVYCKLLAVVIITLINEIYFSHSFQVI